ncbi:MAG: EamA family transporter, partial [Flavobacterium sp.]|nr:EamA family transporter [Flavobacterium sp.]
MQNDNLKSYLHLHVIVFIWGFTAILGKLISLEALDLVWYRMLFASAIMTIVVMLSKEKIKVPFNVLIGFRYLWEGVIIVK